MQNILLHLSHTLLQWTHVLRSQVSQVPSIWSLLIIELQTSHSHRLGSKMTISTPHIPCKTGGAEQLSIDQLQALTTASHATFATDTYAHIWIHGVSASQCDKLDLNILFLDNNHLTKTIRDFSDLHFSGQMRILLIKDVYEWATPVTSGSFFSPTESPGVLPLIAPVLPALWAVSFHWIKKIFVGNRKYVMYVQCSDTAVIPSPDERWTHYD